MMYAIFSGYDSDWNILGYFENKDVDKSELINGAIRHPFDMSGTDTFLRFFLSIEEQSNQEFCKNYFLKSLKHSKDYIFHLFFLLYIHHTIF